MKKNKNPFSGWFWMAVIILSIVGLVRHFHIKNFQVVQPGMLYTSGQPEGMDYTRLLYKYHIAAFVNLRCVDEHRDQNWHNEEIVWMKSNGVKYIELPIEKNVPDEGIPDAQDSQKFLEIMSNSTNLPVLVHDSSGKKRVAYLAAVWMLKSGGYNLDRTIEKVKQIKGQPLTDQEMAFLQSVAK
jgi:protein tyrosine/serine phosphatase